MQSVQIHGGCAGTTGNLLDTVFHPLKYSQSQLLTRQYEESIAMHVSCCSSSLPVQLCEVSELPCPLSQILLLLQETPAMS